MAQENQQQSQSNEGRGEVMPREQGRGQIQRAGPQRAISPFEEMDHIFESFFPSSWLRPFRMTRPELTSMPFEGRAPRVDVIDRDEDVLVRAEVPGVDKDKLEISVDENTVTIKGETSRREEDERGDYYRCEISQGAFARTVAVPAPIDSEKAKARFENGVLELTMPKLEKSKRHTIKVE